jgi:hypothetical protein
MDEYVRSPEYGVDGAKFVFAIVFHSIPGDGSPGSAGDWDYSVRLNCERNNAAAPLGRLVLFGLTQVYLQILLAVLGVLISCQCDHWREASATGIRMSTTGRVTPASSCLSIVTSSSNGLLCSPLRSSLGILVSATTPTVPLWMFAPR